MSKKIGWKFSGATVPINIMANTLYGMSSKKERSEDLGKGYIDELYAIAANIYAELPEDERDDKISKFAGFVASQPDMETPQADIEQALRTKIADMEKSPWAEHIHKNREAQASAPMVM